GPRRDGRNRKSDALLLAPRQPANAGRAADSFPGSGPRTRAPGPVTVHVRWCIVGRGSATAVQPLSCRARPLRVMRRIFDAALTWRRAALAVALLLVAGCDGDSGTGPPSPPGPPGNTRVLPDTIHVG